MVFWNDADRVTRLVVRLTVNSNLNMISLFFRTSVIQVNMRKYGTGIRLFTGRFFCSDGSSNYSSITITVHMQVLQYLCKPSIRLSLKIGITFLQGYITLPFQF